ncbi:MAG: glycosyltransferase family 2 protein [bacterium]|nr:glycosyltransferase family 2 protein [bacterium]
MPRLTAMMPVRNEAGRYLEEVLENLLGYVDDIVILDDASTDATPDICRSFPRVILHRNPEPLFSLDESVLRETLWRLTVATEPSWILSVDADEMLEERMRQEAPALIGQDEYDCVEFRLFDFWGGRTHYRVDGGWNPWARRVRMLFRYRPGQVYTWPRQRLHCGRIPLEAREPLPVYQSDLRVMHLGWVRPEDARRKYEQYRERWSGPHLESVLDPPEKIRLEPWIPGKLLPY